MMPAIRVIAPGLLTTVQDLGRWGWQSRGVPVAGPMDPRAHRLANTLVENPADAATLEVTLVGPALEFEDARIVAVTGAEFEIMLNGQPVPMNGAFRVDAGAVLKFGARLRGARGYVGISGGVAVPPVFGSRATHVPSRMGGLDGRALRAGDSLPLGQRGRESFPSRALPEKTPDPFSLSDGNATVRVLPGPQQDRFAADALEVLQSGPYVVDTQSDRMGFRLHGPRLEHAGNAQMLSDATAVGGLQVPVRGEPILLMADRQTTGGYPIVATVISADIGVAGQLAPGDGVSFVVASFGEAMAALIAQERTLMAFESSRRR